MEFGLLWFVHLNFDDNLGENCQGSPHITENALTINLLSFAKNVG